MRRDELNSRDLNSLLISFAKKLEKSGKNVIILSDSPNFSISVENCKGRRFLSIKTNECSQPRDLVEAGNIDVESLLINGIQVVNLSDQFCKDGFCSMTSNSTLLYRDPNHLNIIGSLMAGVAIKKYLVSHGLEKVK